jgi:hypothetical protein
MIASAPPRVVCAQRRTHVHLIAWSTAIAEDQTGMISCARVPLVVGVLVLGIAMSGLSACGSGSASSSASSVAKQASGAISSAAPEKSVSTAASTKTVTSQAKAQTVTKTAQQPTATASVTKSGSVTVQPTATTTTPTTTGTGSGGGGVPWWGWVLITLGVVGLLAAVFAAGRRRARPTQPSSTDGIAPDSQVGPGPEPPERIPGGPR